ncbi:hypothetical protein ENSA5_04840 [Enhygromyxa salina]|uniref:Uncharacterized protein n=2 Tax=Enhygromyxa salina TaxID=215803 RepID=A0A2S9YI16_9BACT|nr:hypothetical protein ENSA5_04840 [Enhygromyxa salina]
MQDQRRVFLVWPLVGAALACVVGLVVSTCELGRERPEPSAAPTAVKAAVRAAAPAEHPASPGRAAPSQTQRASVSDPGWARLPDAARIELTTQAFERALTRVERDPQDTHAIQEAQRALSLLRTELGTDPSGIRRCDALEDRLAALSE